MLRILFTFAGGTGHFLPLVPLARAAAQAGHVVAFAAQPRMLATVEAAGFRAFDTGGDTLRAATQRTPLLAVDLERERATLREAYAGQVARERASTVGRLVGTWEPDVLVCEEADFGAVVAAEHAAAPHATLLSMASGSFVWRELVAEPLAALREAHGLPPDPELEMLHRYLVLAPAPPSFRDPSNPLPPTAHPIRPVPAEGRGAAGPPWLAELSRPTVLFTLGTIFNLESGDLFERVLAGLRELPVEVVATVGRELDPDVLGPQPANVRVERWVPQSLVLPRCELAVSHGGSGSVIGALAHGVPMVLLPMGGDQPLNAARCRELGVALVLDPVGATPESVREAASTVLGDAAYRERARRIEAEIAALPDPEHGVRLLERLAATRRPLVA